MKLFKTILFASTNRGKFEEVREILSGYGLIAVSPEQFRSSWNGQEPLTKDPIVEEDGKTYLENARKKAEAFFAWAEIPTLGDDSGLEVKALGGAPGLYSARYSGEGATSQMNREKLLMQLREANDRSAKICCSLCLRLDSSRIIEVEASLDCIITKTERGEGGFGYDSLLEVTGIGKTLAEFKGQGIAVKTHRELALDKLMVQLAGS